MKSGKRPTVRQRQAMEWAGIHNTDDWLVIKNRPHLLMVMHRYTGQTKEVPNAN